MKGGHAAPIALQKEASAPHKKGIASTQLAKDIDVTRNTDWFMLHRLRHPPHRVVQCSADGVVEADETFAGGKEKNKHTRHLVGGRQGGKGKAVVFGMLDREGNLRTTRAANLKAHSVQGIICENVEAGPTILSDEHPSFVGLSKQFYHHAVNHTAGGYVRHFCIHTNGIESAWALLRRQIIGIHDVVSPKHLSRYLDEMTWRFIRRDQEEGLRLNNLLIAADRLPLRCQELIA